MERLLAVHVHDPARRLVRVEQVTSQATSVARDEDQAESSRTLTRTILPFQAKQSSEWDTGSDPTGM